MEGFTNLQNYIKNNSESSDKNISKSVTAMDTMQNNSVLTSYTKTVQRPNYDADVAGIIEIVRILNNMAPLRMPIYNFDISEINGDYYYKPDGSLLLVREWDTDIIRDYYVSKADEQKVDRILEHDKHTGKLRTRIEPNKREGSRVKVNITIFDEKINNKYTLMQLEESGLVVNITEFTSNGKSFQTLYRNIETFKPVRYLEGKDTPNGFQMLDCLFDKNGSVVKLKKFTNKKEINIDYTETTKSVSVKNKI